MNTIHKYIGRAYMHTNIQTYYIHAYKHVNAYTHTYLQLYMCKVMCVCVCVRANNAFAQACIDIHT